MQDYNPHALYGYQLIEDPEMVVVEERQVRRTWRERLCSLTPWRAHRIELVAVPKTEFVVLEDAIIGHPDAIRALRDFQGIDDDSDGLSQVSV